MASPVPPDSPYRLKVPSLGVDCPLIQLEGHDSVNGTPRYDVVAAAPSGADLGSWLGHEASVELGSPAHQRNGLLVGCGHLDERSGEREAVRCVVQPRLWRLSKRRQSRVFQDVTAIDIISTLLDEHRVPYVMRLAEPYPPLPYRVQYRETDLSLLERLAGDHGLFWFVEEQDGADVVVLGDSPPAYRGLDEPRRLRRHEEGALRDASPSYSHFAWNHALEPGAVHVRHHDLHRSGQGVDGIAQVDEVRGLITRLSHNDWRETASDPGLLLDYDHVQDHGLSDGAQRLARVRAEQLRRDAHKGHGRTFDPRASSGAKLHLDDHAIEGELVLTSVLHRYHWQADNDHHAYDNEVAATAATTAYRALPPPRREAPSVELATVVAPDAHSGLHTDELGRVRVSFHWNRDDATTSNSCWLRVVQPWAGPGWGSVFVPRDGMEVAVGFAGGDIDSPIVLGALYNGQNRPPFDPRSLQSGFRSQGLDGGQVSGARHELVFDDTFGSERIVLRSEGALEEFASTRAQREVGGAERHMVTESYDLLVGGPANIDSGASMNITVAGDSTTTVRGTTTRRHTGSLEEATEGAARMSANQGIEMSTSKRLEMSCGDFNLTTGDPGSELDSNMSLDVLGHGSVVSSKTLTLNARQRLELVCGETSVVLLPDRIQISSPTVEVEGRSSTTLVGAGAAMALSGGIQVAAGDIVLASSGASLALDANASLDGSLVLLNCGGSDAGADVEALEEQPTKPLHLIMLQPSGLPFAGWQYRLTSAGKVSTGKLDPLGNLIAQVPEHATQAQVQLSTDGAATTHIFKVELTSLPPITTVAGVKARLRNLGMYPHDDLTEEVDETLLSSVRHFQLAHGLTSPKPDDLVDEHGALALDDSTLAALEALAGGSS